MSDLERRIRGLRGNYDARADYMPEPRPQWADIVRDLDEALGDLDRDTTPPPQRPEPLEFTKVVDYGLSFGGDEEPEEWFDDEDFGSAWVAANERAEEIRAFSNAAAWEPVRLHTRTRLVFKDRPSGWTLVEEKT